MTKVSFYVLPETGQREQFACRLAEKAYKQGLAVHLQASDAANAALLDELLWTFRDGSFVPHALISAADESTPVIIATNEAPLADSGLMINLSTDTNPHFSRFDRLAEIIDSASDSRDAGRARYKFYKDRGYELETHKL